MINPSTSSDGDDESARPPSDIVPISTPPSKDSDSSFPVDDSDALSDTSQVEEDDPYASWDINIPLTPATTQNLGRGPASRTRGSKPAPTPDEDPRELIMSEALRNIYFQARVSGAVLGSYSGKPACLIALTFLFQASPTGSSLIKRRFQSAAIKVRFFDPDRRDDFGPAIQALYPNSKPVRSARVKTDNEETVTKTIGAKIALSPSQSVTVGSSVSSTQVRKFQTEAYASIKGMVFESDEATFSVAENEMAKDGVPGVCSVALVVENPGQAFAASLSVKADVGWDWKELLGKKTVWGAKDAPVYFNPNVLARRERKVKILNLGKVIEVPSDEDWGEKQDVKDVLEKYTHIVFN
ncbi:hypothetical protein BDD12DRAFT_800689 [Trichophaea hybrida]|nr:hypothetical protein BDD12DRAFT_800689 [Trichophaea hybrida]